VRPTIQASIRKDVPISFVLSSNRCSVIRWHPLTVRQLISATAPLLIVLVGWLGFGERITLRLALAIALSLDDTRSDRAIFDMAGTSGVFDVTNRLALASGSMSNRKCSVQARLARKVS